MLGTTAPEEKIKGIIETINNPFDNEEHVTLLGNKKKKTERERERQKILDRIEGEKDEDLKEVLRHGNTVEIIQGSLFRYPEKRNGAKVGRYPPYRCFRRLA